MKNILIFSVVLLTACQSSVLPHKERQITDFIPTEKKLEIQSLPKTNFAETNFPNNCEWDNFQRVVDGDTIVTDKYRVRAIGIDTPEVKHPNKPIQKGGIEASDFAKEFFKDSQKVCLIPSRIGDEFDKYDRKLAYIFTETGGDFNLEILKSGHAKGYFYFDFDRKPEFRKVVGK